MVRSALMVAVLVLPTAAFAQDACPEDPNKVEPGLCGCGVADSDRDDDGAADSCIDPAATVAADAVIGYRARIDAGAVVSSGAQVLDYAHVGAGATIGVGATVAVRSVVGARAEVGAGVVIGRRSTVGADAVIGADSVLGRAVSWGAATTSGPRASVGYATTVGADGALGADVTLGSLVVVGDRLDAADGVIVARSVVLGDDVVLGQSTVLGPEVRLGNGSTTGARVRVRKQSEFGVDAQLGDDARVGRGALFGVSARIGRDAAVGAQVTGGIFATVDADEVVPRGTELGDGVGVPEVTAITGPLDWVFEPEQPVAVGFTATDPQGLPLTATWSFVGGATGWAIDDDTATSPIITPPAPLAGPSTVTLRVVVDNGLRQDERTQQLTLFSQASCWDYKNTAQVAPERDRGDGLYWVSASGDVTASQKVWCDQTIDGGGWMLVAERPGPASRDNVEDCGSTLDQFFSQGCGTPAALGDGASYAMSEADRAAHPRTAWLFHQYDDITPDPDDAWIAYTSSDLFASSTALVDRPLDQACNLDGLCDVDEVHFRYHGVGWFGNSLCSASGSTGAYLGNYGLCHAGADIGDSLYIYPSNSLFGDRSAYDETKLWGHAPGTAREYTERIFIRDRPVPVEDNDAPVITGLDVPTSMVPGAAARTLSVSATDADGDALTHQWSIVYAGSGWTLSNATSATPTLRPPSTISGSSYVSIEVSVYDGNGHVANRVFKVDRGTHASCQSWYANGGTSSGLYTIDPQGDGNTLEVYCEQELFGGGWTLISNRRQDASNRETCGVNVQQFFTGGCGAPTSIGPSHSYALPATDRNRLPKSQMMMLHYNSGVPDFDDGVRIDLGSLSDPFPNHSGSVITTPVTRICGANGSNCDSSGTYWVYTGDNWYASSRCTAALDGRFDYRGNYGYCVGGIGQEVASNGLPGGNRSGYDETKLWGYNHDASDAFQERIFYR